MSTPSSARPRARNILLVDDNRDAAMLLSRMLERWGHRVHTAHEGSEALELARAHRPDVVLLDIGLPGMSGYEVADQLRSLDPPFGGTLVALTGHGQDEDRQRTLEAGFERHLLKPVDLDVLGSLLEELG